MNKFTSVVIGISGAFAMVGSLFIGVGAHSGYKAPHVADEFRNACFAKTSNYTELNSKVLHCLFWPGSELGNNLRKLDL